MTRARPTAERVHLDDGTGKPYCKSTLAGQPRTKETVDVTCPFCSALFLADHAGEYRRDEPTPEGSR